MPTEKQIEEARKVAINASFEVLKSAAEIVEKIKPLLEDAAKKTQEVLLTFRESECLFNEIKDTDPIPMREWQRAKALCVKSTLNLHTVRDIESTLKVNLEQAQKALEVSKQKYENATKEPQAEILPFKRRNRD
jgi:translation initiation factor 2 alpha subunit (eIF-2alpha)